MEVTSPPPPTHTPLPRLSGCVLGLCRLLGMCRKGIIQCWTGRAQVLWLLLLVVRRGEWKRPDPLKTSHCHSCSSPHSAPTPTHRAPNHHKTQRMVDKEGLPLLTGAPEGPPSRHLILVVSPFKIFMPSLRYWPRRPLQHASMARHCLQSVENSSPTNFLFNVSPPLSLSTSR